MGLPHVDLDGNLAAKLAGLAERYPSNRAGGLPNAAAALLGALEGLSRADPRLADIVDRCVQPYADRLREELRLAGYMLSPEGRPR